MKKILKFHKLYFLIAAGIILLLSLFIFHPFRTKTRNTHIDKLTIFTEDSNGKQSLIYETDSNIYNRPFFQSQTDKRLHITNTKNFLEYASLSIEQNGEILLTQELNFNQKECFINLPSLSDGAYDISLTVKQEHGTTYYVSTETSFLQAVSNQDISGQILSIMTDINITTPEIEKLSILYPFTWKTNQYYFQSDYELHFQSDTEGCMVIENESSDSIKTGIIYCNTPLWDYKISNIFGEFTENRYYYINAKTVNNTVIDTSLLHINTEDKLNRLLQNGCLILSDHITHILLEGDFDLGHMEIGRLLTLEIAGNIKASKNILFSSFETGPLLIDTVNNNASLSQNIYFETPYADIIWNGNDAISYEYAEQYMNLASYNEIAVSPYIGGSGSLRLTAGNISDSQNHMDFTVDGNYIYLTMGYTNRIDLSDAVAQANLDGEGNCSLIENEGYYYCLVTDSLQNTRGYKIIINNKNYQLPVIYLTTDTNTPVTSKDFVTGSFSIDYNTSRYETVAETVKIRGRGHSSWELEKKPYKIKFDSKVSLFGLPKAKEWVLLANHIDRSLIRNTLALNMGSLLNHMLFMPHSYLVNVFMNGQYQGVYSLSEQIEVKKGRIEGEKDSKETDTDYLLELGGDEEATSFGTNTFFSDFELFVEIKNPDSDVLTEEQYNYIVSYMQQMENAVRNLSGYEEYIDIPSLIDWFLLNEFSYNTDGTFRRSNYFLKKKGGKLYVATAWDFDYAFGNFSLDSDNYSEWICLGNSKTDAYEGKYIKTNWMDYLLTDGAFIIQLKNRWNEIGAALYNEAIDTINQSEQQLEFSAEENFLVWPNCLGVKMQYESKKTLACTTHKEQMDYLRNFIEKRYYWMDNAINNM